MRDFWSYLNELELLTIAFESIKMKSKEKADFNELYANRYEISVSRYKGNWVRGETVYSCTQIGKYLTSHFDGVRPRVVAALSKSLEAYAQTWHLPTTKKPFTGADFVHFVYDLAGQPYKLQVAARWVKLMGIFIPVLRENEEMMYQFEYDYRFDSSKIESAFRLQLTPCRQGIRESLGLGVQSHA